MNKNNTSLRVLKVIVWKCDYCEKMYQLIYVSTSVREHAGTREPGSQEPSDICKLDIKK